MTDVLIIGAGPTGLSLAWQCFLSNISFRIIDEKEGPSTHSKALAIQARTMEILEKMGLSDQFLAKGNKVDHLAYHFRKKRLLISLNRLETAYPFILILPQSETESIFIRNLEEKNHPIEWKTRLLDIIDGKGLIERPTGEKEVIKAKWVIGCDGAHSTVRGLLKIPFRGVKFHETFFLADIKAKFSEKMDFPNLFITKKGLAVLLPFLDNETFRVIFPIDHKIDEMNIEKITETLKERGCEIPFNISDTLWTSKFQIHRRIASFYKKEQVLLAGDSAHLHSPVGGQGMNTCIQDSYNLAWKLNLVLKGAAFDTLLDSYEKERLPVANTLLAETSKSTKLISFSQNFFPPLLYYALKYATKNPKRELKLAKKISQLDVNYCSSPIVRDVSTGDSWQGPKSGERAPEVFLKDGNRFLQLLKNPVHYLLLFEENPPFMEAMQQEYSDWIQVLVINDKEIKDRFYADSKSVYLIRPDGYIGYRSRLLKMEEIIAYLLRIFKPVSVRSKL